MASTTGTRERGAAIGSVAVALIVIGLMLTVDGFRGRGYAPPPAPPPSAAGGSGGVGLTRQTTPAAAPARAAPGATAAATPGAAAVATPGHQGPPRPGRAGEPAQPGGPMLPGPSASASAPVPSSGRALPGGSVLPGEPAQPGGPMLTGPSAPVPASSGGQVLPGAPMLAILPANAPDRPPSARRRSRAGPTLTYPRPTSLTIPAIGVRTRVIWLGANRDGSARIPPLSKPFLVSWFDKGAAPGQAGTADLFGHVDSRFSGPAVFYKLGLLRPGDSVTVSRADHRAAVFRIYSVRMFPKDRFPAARIYAGNGRAELRLVTCGGPFSTRARGYLDNTVAFARLAAVRRS